MDFGMLPPEINSARMYAGPGSGPMLGAASAWDGLAADLYSAAASYGSIVSGLTTGPWSGRASTAMAAAAGRYVTWLSTTATHAGRAAAQARAAASAYETAFAMTVPPPAIAANRSLLESLVATNILGYNTPAIAATEAHYGEMWAQNAAAMYGYAGASAAASTLTPFRPPPPTTNGPVVLSAVPQALQGLATPLSTSSDPYAALLAALDDSRSFLYPVSILSALPQRAISIANMSKSLMSTTGAAAKAVTSMEPAIGVAGLAPPAIPFGGATVSAALGRGVSIGALSAPPTWGAPTPVAPSSAGSGFGPAAPVTASGPPVASPVAPITAMLGNGAGSSASRYGMRPTFVARPPAAG